MLFGVSSFDPDAADRHCGARPHDAAACQHSGAVGNPSRSNGNVTGRMKRSAYRRANGFLQVLFIKSQHRDTSNQPCAEVLL
jgi:hypothetical protein